MTRTAGDVAVIVPCYNEEAAVGAVVTSLCDALPTATVYVFDNASTDATSQVARDAGAVIRTEPRRGKGNVLRRAFADVEADVYVLIDGDDTYDAAAAPALVEALLSGPYDQVVGIRENYADTARRRGHTLGNRLLTGLVANLFGREISDVLSGYRALSRRFVKSFPALSHEFEVEAELTIHALKLRLPMTEVPTAYKERPAGGSSKLRTYRDGVRILWTILRVTRHERPVAFHGAIAGLFAAASLALGIPVVMEFLDTGLVLRFPTAILATGLALIAVLSLVLGLILSVLKRAREEAARLAYLAHKAPGA